MAVTKEKARKGLVWELGHRQWNLSIALRALRIATRFLRFTTLIGKHIVYLSVGDENITAYLMPSSERHLGDVEC